MTIRVLSFDEETLVRAGVRAILDREADIEVIEETDDSQNLVRRAEMVRPDVIVLGLPIGRGDLVSTIRRLILRQGAGRVVALAGADQEEHLVAALRAGLRGVVRKDDPAAELVRAIRAVTRGAASLTPTVAALLLDWVATTEPVSVGPPPVAESLTGRERQILTLVAEGIPDAQIAQELGVTAATVRSHMHHVLTKLEVRDRVQAVAFAYRHGMVGH